MVKYIIDVKEINDKQEFFEKIASSLSQEAGEKIMTLGETLRQEGRQEGKQEAFETIVLNLLKENESVDRISKLTGLPLSEIKRLKTRCKNNWNQ